MKEIPDESVHLIITSPPYWQLKDYGNSQQIGFNDSYEDYINNLSLVWNESYRVLHKGCRLCVNIGDQFARSVYYGRYKVIPIRTEVIKFCETVGFDYMGSVIWQKVTTCHSTGGATVMGSFPYPRNGIIKIDYKFILLFKKYDISPKPSYGQKEQSRMTQEEWNQYFTGHWNFAGEKQDSHLAMFPEELPRRLIKMFSFAGDTVLDPFLGSGTTSLAAKNLKRNSIGYEINEEFLPVIINKLNIEQGTVFHDTNFEVIKQNTQNIDWKEQVQRLPYLFKDPIKFDKKVDPRKLNFGSKVDDCKTVVKNYLKVEQIISPAEIILNNGLKVRLLGVKGRTEKNREAIQFLQEKTKAQKVFIKFDSTKYDDKNNLLCYLYLWNKTFMNAHLIKNGLADVDVTIDFKYKSKFLNLQFQTN